MSLSVAVVIGEEQTGEVAGVLPDLPVTVLGAAIGIYVSFRTNSAYDRWWEGRRLWGQLVNSSRHFCGQILAYLALPEHAARRRMLTVRQVLYVHALRCELRGGATSADPEIARVATECALDASALPAQLTIKLLREHLHQLAQLTDQGKLDARRLQTLDQTIATLLDVQGGCERIRNTPLPPHYARIAELLIRTYAVLLPLAIVDDLHWLAIPVSIVICLAFKLISEVGRVLEDPFTEAWEALPLNALCLTIERNLRAALGDDTPPPATPDEHGVLL